MQVACGQCLGCRLDRTLMWAMRIVHESTLYQDNCFITLTYDDQHVPRDGSLVKSHFQKFIRRLRKTTHRKIRYFQCGEYGDENKRPHYHACLFNHHFPDQVLFKSENGIDTYTSAALERVWGHGFCTVSELNFNTASYTAGYILKKITGKKADDEYLRNDEDGVAYWVLPPYLTMSLGRKKPGGIGAAFYEKYKSDFFPSDESPVPGKGVIGKVPRYYETILQHDNPALLGLVKEMRQAFLAAHKEDFTPERLMDKFICAEARQTTRTL